MELTTYSSIEEYKRQSNDMLINDIRNTSDYTEMDNNKYFDTIENKNEE